MYPNSDNALDADLLLSYLSTPYNASVQGSSELSSNLLSFTTPTNGSVHASSELQSLQSFTTPTNVSVHASSELQSFTTPTNVSAHTSSEVQSFTTPTNADSQCSSTDQSPLNPPGSAGAKQNLPNGASTASLMKRSFSIATGKNAAGNARLLAELDPENHELVRLRHEKRLDWFEIANRLNANRIAANKPPGLTANAVYSRYTRNAPRIAAAKGETWDPDEIIRVSKKRPKVGSADAVPPITGFDDHEDELLVNAYKEIHAETWALVSRRIVEKGGKAHPPDMCSRRFHLL